MHRNLLRTSVFVALTAAALLALPSQALADPPGTPSTETGPPPPPPSVVIETSEKKSSEALSLFHGPERVAEAGWWAFLVWWSPIRW